MKTKITSTEYNEEMWRRQYAKRTRKVREVGQVVTVSNTFRNDCTLIEVFDGAAQWPYQITHYKLVRECKRDE